MYVNCALVFTNDPFQIIIPESDITMMVSTCTTMLASAATNTSVWMSVSCSARSQTSASTSIPTVNITVA